ncbi:MAG: CpaF family protein [archaeon]
MADYLKDLISKAKREKEGEGRKPAPLEEKAYAEEAAKEPSPTTQPQLRQAKPAVQQSVDQMKAELKRLAGPQRQKTESGLMAYEAINVEMEAKKSEIEMEFEGAQKIVLAQYGNATIYKVQGKPLLYYHVPVARPTAAEKGMINTLKEAATRLITISPYKIRDQQQRRSVYYQQILDILRASPELTVPQSKFDFYANAVVKEMVGYGIIDDLVQDDKLEEIMVIGPKMPVYVFHRDYEMMLTNIEFFSDDEIIDLINRIAREVGRRIDMSSPLLDARLPDGSRVNATIPPASVSGATLTIRKFKKDPYSIIDLINNNTLSVDAAAFLWLAVEGLGARPANILISGGTGSGKTTLLNVLASFVMPTERIISIEDTAELSLPMKHWIRLESRPPGREGTGEITMDILTKNSLRMRPDRIIVGEVRHDEAFTLFTAMNTGHDGSMGTVHANTAKETIVRLTSPPMSVPQVMLSALDFIIVENRIHDRKKGTIRRVAEIAEVSGVLEGRAQVQTLFERDAFEDSLKKTGVPSNYMALLEKYSGTQRKELEMEIKARAEELERIKESGERGMARVSEIMLDFIESRKKE